jgi:hypothetical protein
MMNIASVVGRRMVVLLMWYMVVVPAAIKGLGVKAAEHGRKCQTELTISSIYSDNVFL